MNEIATPAPLSPTGPLPESERIAFLDVLRGVALLGVFVANVPWMSIAAVLADPMESAVGSDSKLDAAAKHLVGFLVDTKFITIFSTLFGMGMAIMSERALAAGSRFGRTYARRLLVLLGVGVLHGTLVWFGDILTTYALLGFLAMLFRRRRTKTILVWAASLFAFSALLSVGMMAIDPSEMVPEAKGPDGAPLSTEERIAAETAKYAEAFSSGDFLRMIPVRAEAYALGLVMNVGLWGARTLALFLLGLAIVRSGVLLDLASRRQTLRKLAAIGFAVGVPLQIVYAVCGESRDSAASRCLMIAGLYFGGISLSVAYASLVALWTVEPGRAPRLRALFAAVGRMAFTNYLLQSVAGAIVFNYLGFYDRVGRAAGLLFALAVFAGQLFFSAWWLARFRMGPLEWAWRALTYGKREPFRRSSGATA